jgi:hypothetical protein
VTGEFYFMAFAGLGLSLAGFAGLISALDRNRDAHTPVSAWRIRNIVIGGFALMLAGPATVALYYATGGNTDLAVRVASVLLALINVRSAVLEHRKGPEWPSEQGRRISLAISAVVMAAEVANVVVGSLGLLLFFFLVHLGGSASIFVNTVRDVARGD